MLSISMPYLQMGYAEAFAAALGTILDPVSIVLIVLGVLLGMFMGILPGLGGVVTLALLVPLTFGMDPLIAFMLLTAALGGTNFGGSITAILINTPGSSVNAATLLDGYPMARNGEAGRAIGASAAASAMGAVFGVLVLVASIPILVEIVLLFTPIEIFWLGIWGMTIIATVISDDTLAGIVSALMGLMFAFHGLNQFTLTIRWDYGLVFMEDGLKLIPALIGLFAVAEMINLVSRDERIAQDEPIEIGSGRWTGVVDVYRHRWLFLRSALIGAIIGIIPGAGGTTANYISYFQAVQTSSHPERFGTGDVRGVIASEASNDAKDGGGFIPTLGFGVPGSASMAVLLGAFTLHGIVPGPFLFERNLDIAIVIILSLFVSNILTSLIGISIADKLVYITRLDIGLIAPPVLGFSFLGALAVNNNVYDLFIVLFFGILGFLMIQVNMSRVPMILGLVLGPIVEQNFFRSLQIGDNAGVFFRSPIALVLIALTVLSLFYPILKASAMQFVRAVR